MEVLGESAEQELGIIALEVEKRHFGIVIAEHTLYTLVVEIVTETVHQTRVAVLDSDGHREFLFMV